MRYSNQIQAYMADAITRRIKNIGPPPGGSGFLEITHTFSKQLVADAFGRHGTECGRAFFTSLLPSTWFLASWDADGDGAYILRLDGPFIATDLGV